MSAKENLKVYPAEPYRMCQLGSFGKASYMLIKQFNFPHTYAEEDELISQDSDRCISFDRHNAETAIANYPGRYDAIESWVQSARDSYVLAFLRMILKADNNIDWNGYRVMGTVTGSGHAIFTFQLFAKNRQSATIVYSDNEKAPNILKEPRRK